MSDQIKVLEKPLITITNIIWSFNRDAQKLQVLLVKRAQAPYQNQWALPETFMRAQESADEAALRLIREKIGLNLSNFYTEQLATFTNALRTPKTRALSLAYMTFLPEMPPLKAGYGAIEARWFAFDPADQQTFCFTSGQEIFQTLPLTLSAKTYYQHLAQHQGSDHLAFDHEWILGIACDRIKNKLNYQPTVLLVLDRFFTLREARTIYAPFWHTTTKEIDNSNFKRTHQHLFEDAGTVSRQQVGRPAKLYQLRAL